MAVLNRPPVVGAKIPDIDLVSPNGAPSGLRTIIGSHGAIVYFMRTPTCPVCNAHVKNLARLDANDEFSGVPPIVIVPGGKDAANIVAVRHGTANLSIWASEEGHALFGLDVKMTMQQSGTWVVDSDYTVSHATVSTIPIQGLDHVAVRAASTALAAKSGASAPAGEIAVARHARPVEPEPAALSRPPDPTLGDAVRSEQIPNPLLARLGGLELTSVAFVGDYVQLVFNGPTLSCFTWPTVKSGGSELRIGEPGYRDALCDLMSRAVSSAVEREGDGLRIDLGDAAIVVKPVDGETTGHEVAMLSGFSDHDWMVWRPGEPAFAATQRRVDGVSAKAYTGRHDL